MVKREDRKYPFIPLPLKHWWTLRKALQEQESLPSNIDVAYLSDVLDLTTQTTRHYILPLRKMGLINDNGEPTELAYRWRADKEYPDVCKEILEKAYPLEVRNAMAPNSSPASIEKLIKNILGVTDRTARLMANFYLLLREADPTNQTNKINLKKITTDNKPRLNSQSYNGLDAKSRKVFIVHGILVPVSWTGG
jgi:hypothetical protein